MRSLGPCHHAALLFAGSSLLERQRSCAQSRGLGKRERVCDKAQRSLARTQCRGCPGFIVTWNAVKAGKNQVAKPQPKRGSHPARGIVTAKCRDKNTPAGMAPASAPGCLANRVLLSTIPFLCYLFLWEGMCWELSEQLCPSCL